MIPIILAVLFVLTIEIFFQWRFRKNRRNKISNIHQRLDDPEFKKYTEAITATHQIVTGHPNIGYALKPESEAEYNYAPIGGRWTVKINNLGIRHPEDLSVREYNKKSVILFGDSVTYGAGVNIDETFSLKLRDKARELKKDIDILNFAVGGYSVIDNIGHYAYRHGGEFNPVCVIYIYTIKSIFDLPRTNDPLTGFHLEKSPGSFLLHLLKQHLRGGKLAYLISFLKQFIGYCSKKNIQFIFLPLPALYHNALYPDRNSSLDKYTEAVNFQYACKKQFPDNYFDVLPYFTGTDFKQLYRRDHAGTLKDYEVHLSKKGHDFFADVLLNLLSKHKNIS